MRTQRVRVCKQLLTELIPLSFTSQLVSASNRAGEQRREHDYRVSAKAPGFTKWPCFPFLEFYELALSRRHEFVL